MKPNFSRLKALSKKLNRYLLKPESIKIDRLEALILEIAFVAHKASQEFQQLKEVA